MCYVIRVLKDRKPKTFITYLKIEKYFAKQFRNKITQNDKLNNIQL